MRSPRAAGSASNPFPPDTRAGKSAGHSDESDEEQGSQNHAQPRRGASSGSEDTPVSPNTLVDSEIDPYPDDAVPIGLLASLAISSSRDNAGSATDKTPKTGKANAAAEDDDIVRPFSFSVALWAHDGALFFMILIGRRQQGVFYARPGTEPQLAQIIDREDESTRYFSA